MLPAQPREGLLVPGEARSGIVRPSLIDALAFAPSLGEGDALSSQENVEVRARLDILLWEAGASAVEVPHLAPWLWGSEATFEAMIRRPARGALRGRVLAARGIEVTGRALPLGTPPELV